MNRCVDCESLFDEPAVIRDYNGEQFLVCPFCEGNFEVAVECESCGEISDDVICEKCISELEHDYDTCFDLSAFLDKTVVEIDTLITEVLTREEIEAVLKEEIRRSKVSCRPFLEADKIWLADSLEQLKRKEKKNGN